MEQNTFLATIRSALGHPVRRLPESVPGLFDSRSETHLPEQQTLLAAADRSATEQAALLDVLRNAAAPINLQVHTASSVQEAAAVVAAIAVETDTEWGGAKQVAMHDHPLLQALDLSNVLAPHDIRVHVTHDGETPEEARNAVIASYMGITSAEWCVADSATIAVATTPQQPRATSLVPSVHVAVIRQTQLLATLPELYARIALDHAGGAPAATSFTFISGPSKTADIEACMVHGAHGPRAMHLVVVDA